MKPTKIIWQIFPANLIILLIALTVATWYSTASIETFFLDETQNSLESRCRLVGGRVVELVEENSIDELKTFVVEGGREAGVRLTVIDASGRVLADSDEDPAVMDNHRIRPEVAMALQGKTGNALRLSTTLNDALLYVAIPLGLQASAPATTDLILRSSLSVSSLYQTITKIKRRVALGALVIVFLAIFITLFISRNISRPLEELKTWAERLARGDFSKRGQQLYSRNASREVVTLTKTMERMAENLHDKIDMISNQKNQLETLFSSMQEGIIAVDSGQRIIQINSAACKLFGSRQSSLVGSLLQDLTRSLDLYRQIQHVRETDEAAKAEIVLHGEQTSYLQTSAVPLYMTNDGSRGVLIVLNDVTQLRQLETVRRDFVANVSHELRTPITAIRGYVETMLDGALEQQEDARKFLAIVLRQSARLNDIISDLLALSRIELDSSTNNIELEEQQVCNVVRAALQTCQIDAEKKDIYLHLYCPEDVCLPLNPHLIEQALVNLIVNAIRYSPEQGEIRVEVVVEEDGSRVRITVADRGCGIGAEHLPRVFERFYRSDKARSRELGGTGLGLAIVKHIAQAHNGRVAVVSEEGAGAEFSLFLPMAGRP